MRYDFECNACGFIFDQWREIDRRNDPATCEICGSHASRVWVTAPYFEAFVGSDRHRSRVDAHMNLVHETQAEGIRSATEVEEGISQAHDRAKKLGIPVERILGYKGQKPELTPQLKQKFKKQAVAQSQLIKR